MKDKSIGEDEIYGEFFRCTECNECYIMNDFKFCPYCGAPTNTKLEKTVRITCSHDKCFYHDKVNSCKRDDITIDEFGHCKNFTFFLHKKI